MTVAIRYSRQHKLYQLRIARTDLATTGSKWAQLRHSRHCLLTVTRQPGKPKRHQAGKHKGPCKLVSVIIIPTRDFPFMRHEEVAIAEGVPIDA